MCNKIIYIYALLQGMQCPWPDLWRVMCYILITPVYYIPEMIYPKHILSNSPAIKVWEALTIIYYSYYYYPLSLARWAAPMRYNKRYNYYKLCYISNINILYTVAEVCCMPLDNCHKNHCRFATIDRGVSMPNLTR